MGVQKRKYQMACKPGSVPPSPKLRGRGPFFWDGCRHPPRATDPDGDAENITCRPYLVLLPVGLALPLLLPGTRCALTAPFQPCRGFRPVGGVISVALSLGSPPPDVIRHRLSVEPGLSSNPLLSPRSPGHLTPQNLSWPGSAAQAERDPATR